MPLAFLLLLAAQTEPDDPFIAGYATAILERDFSLPGARVAVLDGVIRLSEEDLRDKDRAKIVAALLRIRGVRNVTVDAAVDGGRAPLRPDALPVTGGGWKLFADERLFSPLLADPRWPRFSLGFEYYLKSSFPDLRHAGTASLGEQFTLVSYQSESVGRFGLGLQPAVFALFNLDAASMDLVNADYRLALPLDYRAGGFSAEARVLHQSSHLGDEFLLDTPVQRVNLSYEAVELRLSIETANVRFYGGAGRLVHSDPEGLLPWTAQQGIEATSPVLLLNDSLRPFLALDVQEREETGWTPDVSVRAGLDFASPEMSRRRVQFFVEYFHGRNPNGQFFRNRVEILGAGLQVYF